MKDFTLTRLFRFRDGTFGKIPIPGYVLATVECPGPPYVSENAVGRACIPAGRYAIAPGTFRHNNTDPRDDEDCIDILDVPGRELIKIHPANLASELRGCIAVGMRFGWIGETCAVLESRRAMSLLLGTLGGSRGTITVVEGW